MAHHTDQPPPTQQQPHQPPRNHGGGGGRGSGGRGRGRGRGRHESPQQQQPQQNSSNHSKWAGPSHNSFPPQQQTQTWVNQVQWAPAPFSRPQQAQQVFVHQFLFVGQTQSSEHLDHTNKHTQYSSNSHRTSILISEYRSLMTPTELGNTFATMSMTLPQDGSWYVDSGAMSHMINNGGTLKPLINLST